MRSLKFTIAVGFLVLSISSFASDRTGGMEGGGGKTVVCRNPDETIQSSEVLDLYEGRTVYQLTYNESPMDWQNQAEEMLEISGYDVCGLSACADPMPPHDVYGWLRSVLRNLVFLPPGTALQPINDSLEAIIPKGCNLEQTIHYQNDQRILVDTEIWNSLSNTQKAALMIHEATYRNLRQFGETDSRRARHLTAHISAGKKIEPTFPGNNFDLLCTGGDSKNQTVFYVSQLAPTAPGESEALRLYFDVLGGRFMMSRAWMDLPLEVDHETTLLEQLKQPSRWISYGNNSINSYFEAGDSVVLSIHPVDLANETGKYTIKISGTSIVDGSYIGPVEITCR